MTKVGLVLGAGGMVGLAYHAGVLHALEELAGVVANDADLIVGTSAGSVAGAYLRSGWSTEDFWQLALGTHPELQGLGSTDPGRKREIFVPTFRGPLDLWRRGMGSSFVLARSLLRMPAPRVPSMLQWAFPGGMFTMVEGRRRFAEELPDEWPDRELWLCAVNIGSGRRIVLGRGEYARTTSLRRAALASCAIPGLYQPVRIGSMTLVDGGAVSTTNLDLAVAAGCDLIIGVVPMAFDTERRPHPLRQLVRRIPSRALSAELAGAKRAGATVLLLRPSPDEVRLHGLDVMRGDGLDAVAMAAYESTARALETRRFQEALASRAD